MPLMANRIQGARAAKAIVLLLELALSGRSITYGELAKRLGMSNPRHVVKVIGQAGEVIDAFFAGKAPDICVLVVGAASRIPGDGFISACQEECLPLCKETYLKLPLREKRKIINELQKQVFSFDRWEALLAIARDFYKYSV